MKKKELSETELKKKMLKPVGKKVHFNYPGNEENKDGRLIERIIIESNNVEGKTPYYDVVDKIEFDHDSEPWMRIGYYRTPNNRLVWGSQTTITEPLSVWKDIITQASIKMPWFKRLLLESLNEI